MARVWTHGVWRVKPGSEEAFLAAWRAMRDGVMEEFGDVDPPTILRDHEHPNVFVSFGPWPDLARVAQFRGSRHFREALDVIGHLVEDVQTTTLDEVNP